MKKTILIILSILFSFVSNPLISQEKQNRLIVDLPIGFSVPLKYYVGLTAGIDLSIHRGERVAKVYSVGYSLMEEFSLDGSAYSNSQIAFMLGRQLNIKNEAIFHNSRFSLYILGGAGPVWGERRILPSGREDFLTAGLFLSAGVKTSPFRYAGLRADIECNINPKNPVFLFTLGLSIGKQYQ